MSMRYNPPPNWPQPPAGWTPPAGWRPDPAWGPAPPGWQLWLPASGPAVRPSLSPIPHPALRSTNAGTALVAVAAGSCGFAGFVPPLWAATQRPLDVAFRRRMRALAGGLAALMITGLMLTAGNTEEDGTPTGFLGDLGGVLLFINLAVSITVAVLVRNAGVGAELPGVAEELARRRLREQYRQLATNDPSLARSMAIGRPDLPRRVDDGGLLDLNAIPADRLTPLTGLSPEEAERVAHAREQLGRFTSINELALYADLPESTASLLGERAVFI
ncbi:helix-hairpin-helix domain-containing protein [Nocardioides sp. zg-DK7169]|uniref:helix-hairpin-helix domain-containing protein n=1 Tax=Nocardioides sp. zg-DK7169 TaxID=2736600 RepID=UPI001556544C|nr:helix-hairpin-helix domain-containing protein [Nocardioides sp. zg-DK7169]NPC97825.1 hypothetical protein [Nocardioides sp. zg-DK7169]